MGVCSWDASIEFGTPGLRQKIFRGRWCEYDPDQRPADVLTFFIIAQTLRSLVQRGPKGLVGQRGNREQQQVGALNNAADPSFMRTSL
jgi:hypothetical protein